MSGSPMTPGPARPAAPPRQAAAPPAPSTWKPLLLSALVFPGLGQLAAGRPWRGLGFAASSALILVMVVSRVYRETERLLPQEPEALLDPTLPFTLAVEIQRQNAGFFLLATLALLAIWAGSIVEAWLVRPR